MNLEQTFIKKLKILPLDKQQEVLDFIEFLTSKLEPTPPIAPYPSLKNTVISYRDPFEPAIPPDDWGALQ